MEGGGVIVSGYLIRKMVNIQFTRKVESDRYLGQVMECLFGILQRDIIVALGHQ